MTDPDPMPGRAHALRGAVDAAREHLSPRRTIRRLPASAAGAALGFFLSVAQAHQAPSGWEYDPACCSGRDCAAAPAGAVQEVAGGYRVTLLPGQHPMVQSAPFTAFVPHGDARIRPSGDEHYHPCIWAGRLLCLYRPPGGM